MRKLIITTLSNRFFFPPVRVLLLTASLLPAVGRTQEMLDATVITSDTPSLALDSLLLADEVSSLRTGAPLTDVPRSVTVFSEERLQEQGITSLGELVDYTPGLNNTQGEGHRDAIVFRGVRSTADFFIDGVRDDVQYYRSLYNIEQVEVLRGPSALFFGRGGTGGIINRVIKKPVFDDEFIDAQFTIDSFGATLSQFDWNQPLGGGFMENGKEPVVMEPWGSFRFNGFYETLANHRDFFEGERIGVNPTMAFNLGPDTRLDLSYEYNQFDRFIDRGIPTGANGRPVESLANTVFGDPEQNMANFESHALRATLNHTFSNDWKGRVTAFYGDYDKSYRNFYASDYDEVAELVTIDGYVDSLTRQNLVFSGDLVGELSTGVIDHTVIIGAEFINTSSDQDRYNTLWDTTQEDTEIFKAADFRLRGGSAINSVGQRATNRFNADRADDTRVNIDSYSVFVQDEIGLTEHLDLIAGARFDSFDIEVFDALNGGTRTRRDQEVSPRLGVVLKPVEAISVYGSYSESFLPRSGEQFADINGSNNALDPNTYSNLEAGIKWDLQPDLSLSVAVFEIEETSPQVSDLDAETLDVIDTQTTGFEAQLAGYLTDQWSISAGYSYLDGEQVDSGGATGLRPRELPEHTFSVWNNYRVTDRFGLGLGVVYQDQTFVNNSNSAVLPSYTRVDAAAYYLLNERTRVQLNVENLLDTQYFPTSHSTHEVTVGRPINVALTVSMSF